MDDEHDKMDVLGQELERCRPWIEAALDEGGNTHTFEDIANGVRRARYQFWPAPDACAITEIVEFPRKMYLHIFLAGGRMETIVDMNASAERLARELGCNGMSISGRPGWKKVLSEHGYKPKAISLSKEF